MINYTIWYCVIYATYYSFILSLFYWNQLFLKQKAKILKDWLLSQSNYIGWDKDIALSITHLIYIAIIVIFSAQAAVYRDFTGSIIKCISLISSPCSPLYGEALAALLACWLATSMSLWRLSIQHLLQIGELLPSSPTFSSSSLQLLTSKLVMLTEVQTSVPIMWQIEPQLEFILAAFPSFSHYPHRFLHVLEKIPPPPSLSHKLELDFFHSFRSFYNVLTKKKYIYITHLIFIALVFLSTMRTSLFVFVFETHGSCKFYMIILHGFGFLGIFYWNILKYEHKITKKYKK